MERKPSNTALELLREAQRLVGRAIELESQGHCREARALTTEIIGTVEGARLLIGEEGEVGGTD